jgi:hypothetical protein
VSGVAPMTRDEATCIVRSIFRRCGYAIGEHGTRGRDLDLMAMPWTDRAGIPELIVEEVASALEAPIVNGPEDRPHGRRVWSIHPRHTARHDFWYIDLSVIVPERYRTVQITDEMVECAWRAIEQQCVGDPAPSRKMVRDGLAAALPREPGGEDADA